MSTDPQAQINSIVNNFVRDITVYARTAAQNALTSALEGVGAMAKAHVADAGDVVAARAARSATSAKPAGKNGRRHRRDDESMAEVMGEVLGFVKRNPGLRIEQINTEMGKAPGELALPLKKLIADGVLRTEGNKRATAYFVRGTKAAKAKAKKAARAAKPATSAAKTEPEPQAAPAS